MNALSRLFGGSAEQVDRNSARIRDEINALIHPARLNAMLVAIGERRTELATLSGVELKDAECALAASIAEADAYRAKHSGAFAQADALSAELIATLGSERQAIISDRLLVHAGREATECARLASAATQAATESLAQRVATHLLAKSWGLENVAPWQFGFPPKEIEACAREILSKLQHG